MHSTGYESHSDGHQNLIIMDININISEQIREGRLRWSGHVDRKTEEDVMIRTWKM